MEPVTDEPPLVVITGQTASGKSSMAVDLAAKFNGEIICADSRTVYKGMDIGTAKPTPEDQRKVPHHLLDITTPDHPITAADFKRYAEEALDRINSRDKLAFLAGGTGLYIDAVVFNFSFRPKPGVAQREELLSMPVAELRQIVMDTGLPLPENKSNARHLIRQIESSGIEPKRTGMRKHTLVLGIELDKEELEARIAGRLEDMFKAGLEVEVRRLVGLYGWDCRALQTIGYQEFRPYFEGECTLDEVKEAVFRHSLQYAKRQKTWFRRNKHIQYIRKAEESVDLITTLLNKRYTAE